MNQRDFIYWLRGFFELNGYVKELDQTKTKMIKDHLDLVFQNEADQYSFPFRPAGVTADLSRYSHATGVVSSPSVPEVDPNPYVIRC